MRKTVVFIVIMIPCNQHFLSRNQKLFVQNRQDLTIFSRGDTNAKARRTYSHTILPSRNNRHTQTICGGSDKKGFQSITFTEHAPLPPSFTDPTPQKDSAMAQASLERYINEISGLKKNIADSLTYGPGLRSIILLNTKMKSNRF